MSSISDFQNILPEKNKNKLAVSVQSWESLKTPLSSETLKILKEDLKFSGMTSIQAAIIPLFLSYKVFNVFD